MTIVQIEPVSFDYEGAAAATGLSSDVIQKAVRSGDLQVRYPKVDGRTIAKPVVMADELRRWISAGAIERKKAS